MRPFVNTVLASAGEHRSQHARSGLRLVVRTGGGLVALQFVFGGETACVGDLPLQGFETVGLVLTGTTATQLTVVGITAVGMIGAGPAHLHGREHEWKIRG